MTYGTAIDKSTSKVSVATLVSGHSLSAITLAQSTTNAPGGTITPSGAKIVSGSTDVTSNYAITYKTGTLTINVKQLSAPTNIKITTAGIVTWSSVSNASKYKISIDGTNWTDATSGVDYLSKIIASTGTRTVYVRAVGTGNYSTSNSESASVTVYTVSFSSSSTTMGTVDTSSYNVINGTTYSANSNKLLFNGITTGTTTKTLKTVTASPKSNYAFNSWSSNSGSISSNTTLTAYFRGADYTISLNNNGASTAGTSAIYQRYATGIYLDSAGSDTKIMSSTSNPISVPSKPTYFVQFSENGSIYAAEFSPKFNGYYTATSSGNQMINSSGYITSKFTNTYYTSNATLYAQWNHNYTLPKTSKAGYTCSWNTKTDGTGTKYNSGATASITADTTLYSVCTANSYTVTFNPNGGTVATTSASVKFGSAYGTLPTPTRADSTDSASGKTISYAFEGWYTAANGGTKVTDTSLVNTASDHSIYAHWISKPIITGGSADWFNKKVNIKLEVPSTSDTGSVKYQYYVSTSNSSQLGGEWKDTSASGSATVSSNGIHYVFYRAISSAGVYSNVSNFQTVKIDTQGPINLTVNNPKNNVWSTSDVTVTLSATDTGSGVKEFQWYENDAWTTRALTTSGNSATITFVAERNTTIRFRAVDNVGNASSEVTTIVKIDKTTPTAPVLTGGSASWTSSCGTIKVGTAGTTGPSGIAHYEAELENMLNGGSIHRGYNQLTYKDNGYWQTTGTDPYVAFNDLGNVYMTHARVGIASATPVAMTLQVFYWTEGSGPTEANSSKVDVPAGTSGYVDIDIPDGTYDGLRFDFGNTANVTYQFQFWGYVRKYTTSDTTSVCNRGLNRVRYRTVANNGLKSNWSDYDSNNGSKVLINNDVIYDSGTGLTYSTFQKAVNILGGSGGSQNLQMRRSTSENIAIGAGNFKVDMKNYNIKGYIKNYSTLSLLNGSVDTSGTNETSAIVNTNTLTLNNVSLACYKGVTLSTSYGNVSITNGGIFSDTSNAILIQSGNVSITNSNSYYIYSNSGSAVKINSGSITYKGGYLYANDGNALSGAGTINIVGGIIYSNSNAGISSTGTVNVSGGTLYSNDGNAIYSTGTINVTGGEIYSKLNSGIYSIGAITISGGKIYTNAAGKNAVFVYSGTAKMTAGTLQNVVNDSNCAGVLTIAEGVKSGFSMSGGTINGCVGINYRSGATGNVTISGTGTTITGAHTGIYIHSTSSDILRIGISGNTSTANPSIKSTGNYYAVDLGDKNLTFRAYSGRLTSSKSGVFRGKVGKSSCSSTRKTFKASGTTAYCR